jgi:hypothetical protein
MSKRVSRVGTADKPPTVEENVGRLELKMKEMELKMELKEKADEIQKNNFIETVEMFKTDIRDIKDNLIQTITKIETFEVKNHEEKAGLGKRNEKIEENIQQMTDKVERVANALEHVQEKMYDFEANKKNNLIFYGITNEGHEKENKLIMKVKELIKANMNVRRELVITTASRMFTGPEVFGCRPVLVTFEEFKDREEVLKNSKFIKKLTISVTEDLSKRTRESRQELRKFMRHVKRINPEKRCFLQYDKLFIDGKVFVYSESSGAVEQQKNVLGHSEDVTSSRR